MAYKLAEYAEENWRRLKGSKLVADVISVDSRFVDGTKVAFGQ